VRSQGCWFHKFDRCDRRYGKEKRIEFDLKLNLVSKKILKRVLTKERSKDPLIVPTNSVVVDDRVAPTATGNTDKRST